MQRHVIPIISSGRDLVCTAETGSGKTAAFLLPLVNQIFQNPPEMVTLGVFIRPLVLIICPTRELCTQIYEESLRLTYRSFVKCANLLGGHPVSPQCSAMKGSLIVVCTPGRILDLLRRKLVDLSSLRTVVIDEADKMLDQGFRDMMIGIISKFGAPKNIQKLLFSATLPSKTQELAARIMKEDFLFIAIGKIGKLSETVEQVIVKSSSSEKIDLAADMICRVRDSNPSGALILLFVNRKVSVSSVAVHLGRCISGMRILSLHGGMDQPARTASYASFLNNRFAVLVTTDVSQRGLDISRLQAIINFDMPPTIEAYTHRIGRVARLGRPGLAISILTNSDYGIAGPLVQLLEDSNCKVPKFLKTMVSGGYDHAL